MGYSAQDKNTNAILVEIPRWRADILHEIDLVEDVAVGYGFDKFSLDYPKAFTFGKTLRQNDLYNGLRNIMIGLGFNEITTFTISNERDEFIKMGSKIGKRVQIENPIGEEFSCIRVSLLPSLLKILNENRHNPLPQMIFEVGIIVNNKFKNQMNLAAVKIDAKSNFTECKFIIEAVLRESGVIYKITDKFHPAFVKGRCAKIINNSQDIIP